MNMAGVDSPKERVDWGDVGLALLGFASGSMDALAFFNLGEVFPSAMTGNTALLGLALGQGHLIAASPLCRICRLSGRRNCGCGER
jgi:uncharacterized membrane protein YoaK (UPF0700 family)